MLLAILVHAEALEVNISSRAKLRLDGAGDINRALKAKLRHAILHHRELHHRVSYPILSPTQANDLP